MVNPQPTKGTILYRRCAWCSKVMGEKDGEGVEGVSDGICDDCVILNFPHRANKIIEERAYSNWADQRAGAADATDR